VLLDALDEMRVQSLGGVGEVVLDEGKVLVPDEVEVLLLLH